MSAAEETAQAEAPFFPGGGGAQCWEGEEEPQGSRAESTAAAAPLERAVGGSGESAERRDAWRRSSPEAEPP